MMDLKNIKMKSEMKKEDGLSTRREKMPRLYCLKCKSEWKSTNPLSTCEFCGTKGNILEEKTSFEKFADKLCDDLDKPKTVKIGNSFKELL